MERRANQSDAVNPAIAPRFHVGRHWRGVTDPHRYAPMKTARLVAVLVIFCVTAGRADSPLAPAKRYEVESPSKKFVATVDPKKGVSVRAVGAQEILWKAKRIWSRVAFLADDGEHFVTGYD